MTGSGLLALPWECTLHLAKHAAASSFSFNDASLSLLSSNLLQPKFVNHSNQECQRVARCFVVHTSGDTRFTLSLTEVKHGLCRPPCDRTSMSRPMAQDLCVNLARAPRPHNACTNFGSCFVSTCVGRFFWHVYNSFAHCAKRQGNVGDEEDWHFRRQPR